jgi:hypothetical protein
MDGTAHVGGADLIGHTGHTIRLTPRPHGRRHYDLAIGASTATSCLVPIHHECAQRHRVSLVHGHASRAERVAIAFPLLRGGCIRLPRAFLDGALGQRGGADGWRRELLRGRRACVLNGVHAAFMQIVCVVAAYCASTSPARSATDGIRIPSSTVLSRSCRLMCLLRGVAYHRMCSPTSQRPMLVAGGERQSGQ